MIGEDLTWTQLLCGLIAIVVLAGSLLFAISVKFEELAANTVIAPMGLEEHWSTYEMYRKGLLDTLDERCSISTDARGHWAMTQNYNMDLVVDEASPQGSYQGEPSAEQQRASIFFALHHVVPYGATYAVWCGCHECEKYRRSCVAR